MNRNPLTTEEMTEIAAILKAALEHGTSGWSPTLLKEVRKITASPLFLEENKDAINEMFDLFKDKEKMKALMTMLNWFKDGKGFWNVLRYILYFLIGVIGIVRTKDVIQFIKYFLNK